MTVLKATEKAFNILPDTFKLLDLIDLVRIYTERPALTDGTITRRLRELRADPESEVNYRVIDTHRAIYEKIFNGQQKLEL